MLGIIGAMDIEIEGIRSLMTEKREKVISGISFVSGKLGACEVVTAVCGIGKVFAAICAQSMILEFNPDAVINTGVAGGLSPELKIGDIAVANNVVQHDMDPSALGDPKGLIPGLDIIYIDADQKLTDMLAECVSSEGMPLLRGTIATGDQFVATSEKKNCIIKDFSAIATEMEGAAIGQVCYVNKKPFAVLRAISDSANENSVEDYPAFAESTAKKYISVVLRFAEMYGKDS